jgi:hypothetical protein
MIPSVAPTLWELAPTYRCGRKTHGSRRPLIRPSVSVSSRNPRPTILQHNKDRVDRAQKPIIRWKATVPQSSRTDKDLFWVISDKRLVSQPHFPGATLVRDSTKTKICFGFCIERTAGGCKKKPNKTCRYIHLDRDSVTQTGPENLGSLTEFLQLPLVADKLEYTDVGRTLSQL